MKRTSFRYVLLAAVVVVGLTVPAAALAAGTGQVAPDVDSGAAVAPQATQNDSTVNVTVGQQLSTVLSVSSDEVQTDFENTAFELSVERPGVEERAEAIADRAEELRERAEDIREAYAEATEEYGDGDIGKSAYAQRLATLNARATNLQASYDALQQRAANLSALELRAAGVNESALRAAVENLSSVSGSGAKALLAQFTGEARGEIELETADGLEIEVEGEDGERSREFERPRDDDRNFTVAQADALTTARDALSTPDDGRWVLTKTKVKEYEGAYEFEFALRNASQTGEAEVRVDASTGEVYRLEEEIEAPDEDDEDGEDRDEERDDDRELALVVAEGAPAPNATVTLQVLDGGDPVENVALSLNDEQVGTTDANGTVTVSLPESGEAKLAVESGDAEAELEFEFEEDDDEVFRNLHVDATLDDGTVTVTVSYDGSAVANASVYANGQAVGTTDADGRVTFAVDANATEDLEVEVVKGEFEAELEYDIENGSLALTEDAREGDGDKVEREAEDDAEDGEDAEDDSEDDDREADRETEDDSDDESEDAETPDDDSDSDSDEEETETPDDEETETAEDDEETETPDEEETETPDDEETETSDDDEETDTPEDDDETETSDDD
ncbi:MULTISPECIES: DUF7096 domain-containing protein [Salinibaculum]|uniref:DUF7096 domain-containing protein n=1 Tax=Salinibaculum TaxID=2732368 RepID=UPI0030D08DB8